MVVGKYIFVILSAFCHRKFRVMGVEKGANAFLDFIIWHFLINFFAKKVVFLVLSGKNVILPHLHFWPPAKIFLGHPWKSHYWSLPRKN